MARIQRDVCFGWTIYLIFVFFIVGIVAVNVITRYNYFRSCLYDCLLDQTMNPLSISRTVYLRPLNSYSCYSDLFSYGEDIKLVISGEDNNLWHEKKLQLCRASLSKYYQLACTVFAKNYLDSAPGPINENFRREERILQRWYETVSKTFHAIRAPISLDSKQFEPSLVLRFFSQYEDVYHAMHHVPFDAHVDVPTSIILNEDFSNDEIIQYYLIRPFYKASRLMIHYYHLIFKKLFLAHHMNFYIGLYSNSFLLAYELFGDEGLFSEKYTNDIHAYLFDNKKNLEDNTKVHLRIFFKTFYKISKKHCRSGLFPRQFPPDILALSISSGPENKGFFLREFDYVCIYKHWLTMDEKNLDKNGKLDWFETICDDLAGHFEDLCGSKIRKSEDLGLKAIPRRAEFFLTKLFQNRLRHDFDLMVEYFMDDPKSHFAVQCTTWFPILQTCLFRNFLTFVFYYEQTFSMDSRLSSDNLFQEVFEFCEKFHIDRLNWNLQGISFRFYKISCWLNKLPSLSQTLITKFACIPPSLDGKTVSPKETCLSESELSSLSGAYLKQLNFINDVYSLINLQKTSSLSELITLAKLVPCEKTLNVLWRLELGKSTTRKVFISLLDLYYS